MDWLPWGFPVIRLPKGDLQQRCTVAGHGAGCAARQGGANVNVNRIGDGLMVRIEDARRLPVAQPWLTSRMTTVGSASQRQKSGQGSLRVGCLGLIEARALEIPTFHHCSLQRTCTSPLHHTGRQAGRQGTRLGCMHHTLALVSDTQFHLRRQLATRSRWAGRVEHLLRPN